MPKFNENPVLNSPYEEPKWHWSLDDEGVPTGGVTPGRRQSKFLMPIPKATIERRRQQGKLNLQADTERERDNPNVNFLRKELAKWREKPLDQRGLSDVTVRLLQHWSEDKVTPRPFFCQIEAVETFIWLNEFASSSKSHRIREVMDVIDKANAETNLGLPRLAAKMATGAGKTTVMAMLIAYYAINKARNPNSSKYSNQFLIITPGITIKDRLRVLLPQDPNNYYAKNNIVPPELQGEMKKATVIITNYHAFKLRENLDLSTRQRQVLQGNDARSLNTKETEGEMLRRVCRELLSHKDKIVVINDEAHHCYIHRDASAEKTADKDEQEETKRNNEAARLWINGINALRRETDNIKAVYDLSATPFFLRGSGHTEGDLFPWVVSDFSLMDAIESGIVKLPRVPTRDAAGKDLPVYRDLYKHISDKLPRAGRGGQKHMNPQDLPSELMGALQALYSNYEETHKEWEGEKIDIPPAFIIVCNNTSTSKLVYDLVSGYETQKGRWRQGEYSLFNNVKQDRSGLRARPRTLLIDSYQLESGEALNTEFRKAAAAEINQFKEEIRVREPSRDISKITDAELLREAMNTVGKKGRLGEQIRCVVSVSMLTEGWDTNNVTHILGVRAFGTQLLCEQVVGRALRRYNYQTESEGEHAGKFLPEYAEVFGVPFKFASGSETQPVKPPKQPARVRHLDERANLEIRFPRVRGYRIKPAEQRITAKFTSNSHMHITQDKAPSRTAHQGIVGKDTMLTLDDLKKRRKNEVVYSLAAYITERYYKEEESGIAPARFRDLVPIVRHWLKDYVHCQHGTRIQYLLWHSMAVKAAEIIYRACVPNEPGSQPLLPVMDNFTPEGSTAYVDFLTRKNRLHKTHPDKSHINIAVCDSDWEMEFCKALEAIPEVFAYTRNEGLRFEIPYAHDNREHTYLPDYIVLLDDGHGPDDLLHLVFEVKGIRDLYAQAKADTMKRLWIPAVNNHGEWGRWAFEEMLDIQDWDTRRLDGQSPLTEVLSKYINCHNGKGGS